MKTCSKCGVSKRRDEFYKRKASNDGLQPKCISCQKIIDTAHYQANSAKKIGQATAWRKAHPESYSAYRRQLQSDKEASDINYRLARRLRSRLYKSLVGLVKAGSAVGLLCCSVEELRLYLEAQFEPGMTWENYGHWHVDHVLPLGVVDLQDPRKLAGVCQFLNLRPLWARHNESLGGRLRHLTSTLTSPTL